MKILKVFLIVIFLLTIIANASFSEENLVPFLKSKIDTVIDIYNNSKSDEKKIRFEKEIKQIFDFNTISRLSVARKWRKFSKEDKEKFTQYFSKLLINTYYDKLKNDTDKIEVTIEYLKQEKIKEKIRVVKTRIPVADKKGVFTPIDYRLLKNKEGDWKIYDIHVEGISLIKNYREQFAEILMKNPPEYLINKVKNMVEKK